VRKALANHPINAGLENGFEKARFLGFSLKKTKNLKSPKFTFSKDFFVKFDTDHI